MLDKIRLMIADGVDGKVTRKVQGLPELQSFELLLPENNSEQAMLKHVATAQAILTYQTAVPAAVINAAPQLKLIQKHGLNCRAIDVEAATRRDVRVGTTQLLRSISVAEHAMTLMLACARKVLPGHQAVSGAVYQKMGLEPYTTSELKYFSNWAKVQGLREVFGATVGIIGMGDIGMEIAQRARAFAMNIVYHQRSPHPQSVDSRLGMRYLPMDDLLSTADYVILVLPHTPQTEGLMNANTLARMKPAATLINVGRGGLIDEDALVAILRARPEMMAALDVYRTEPCPVTSPLLTLPNVILLPHMGSGSYRSNDVDPPASLRNIIKFFAGEKVEGIIN